MKDVQQPLPGDCKLRTFNVHADPRGCLVALEDSDLGFEVSRVYYIYGTDRTAARGFHAHIALRQVVIAVSGGCTLLLDDGMSRAEVRLDQPHQGLWIEQMVWKEMRDFTPDCVLLLLASERFDERDYIRDYGRFREVVRDKRK